METEDEDQTVAEYWNSFVASLAHKREEIPARYQAWSFGYSAETADKLSKLVVEGVKTATASLAWAYELESEPFPEAGDYSVVLDSASRPVCIIQTTEVEVVPFNKVAAEHAYQEGEGDRSLAFWRKVHWEFFAGECEVLGRKPSKDMPVVCEKFKLVFL